MRLAAWMPVVLLAGCAAAPTYTSQPETAKPPARGGYYKDDGPGGSPPANLDQLADAVPRVEPLHRYANRPYNRFGKDYVPMTALAPFRQTGIASWYGRRFHGQPTSSGEIYDMYAMTAAHPTLPVPSYARVTNPANGRSVVVRVNDRGPFHAERIIDLSYAAAWKLGIVNSGSARVVVEAIVPGKVAENPALVLLVR
jgi:rare lipoprotein A